jgi:hypothetical protein
MEVGGAAGPLTASTDSSESHAVVLCEARLQAPSLARAGLRCSESRHPLAQDEKSHTLVGERGCPHCGFRSNV